MLHIRELDQSETSFRARNDISIHLGRAKRGPNE
jgi:hypothetical protein